MTEGLEIFEYNGEGYNRTMHYGEWRVAILNYAEPFDEEKAKYMERHFFTDEVFVLLSGKAKLVIGLDKQPAKLESGKLYNVKAGVWHQIFVSKDAKVLVIENHNTSVENSEKSFF